MNKKLLTSAITLLLAGGMTAATADVKLYGQLDLSVRYLDSDANGFDDDTNLKSTTSAIGVMGSEDLGNGMNAFFKVEYQTDLANDSNGNGWNGRDQYVGLGSRFGKLYGGTMSTAYKTPGSKIDPFYRTQVQSRNIGLQSNLHSGKGEDGQGRATNTIRYDSPKFLGGAQFNGTYTLDSNANNNVGNGNDDNPYSLGLTYTGGNFYAFASYIDTQANDDTAAAQVGGKYTFGNFAVRGIYELDKGLISAQANNGVGVGGSTGGRTGGADDDGADVWSLGADYTFGNNLIAADYGKGSGSDGKNGIGLNCSNGVPVGATVEDCQVEEYDAYRLGAMHHFSKRTMMYVAGSVTDYNDKGKDTTVALGVRHNF